MPKDKTLDLIVSIIGGLKGASGDDSMWAAQILKALDDKFSEKWVLAVLDQIHGRPVRKSA